MTRIIPTVGRVMHYWPQASERDAQPYAAHVAHVWDEDTVNLMVISPNGTPFAAISIPIIQPGSRHYKSNSPYVEWMDYQRGQAAKHDAADKARNLPRD